VAKREDALFASAVVTGAEGLLFYLFFGDKLLFYLFLLAINCCSILFDSFWQAQMQ
jgi:hypothetical protein